MHGVFGANGKNRPEDVRSFAINRTEVFGYVAPLGEEGEERNDEGPEPSSGTKNKQTKKKIAQAAMSSFLVSAPPKPSTQKASKSVSAMLYKTLEEVVA